MYLLSYTGNQSVFLLLEYSFGKCYGLFLDLSLFGWHHPAFYLTKHTISLN